MPETANVIEFDPDRRRRTNPTTSARRPRPAPSAPTGMAIASALESWELTLASRDRSAGTIRSYRDTILLFQAWLSAIDRCTCAHDAGDPCPAADVTPDDEPTSTVLNIEQVANDHIRLFLIHERKRNSAANAHKQFRNLRAFFRFVVKRGYRSAPTPVDSDDAPRVTEREYPPLTEDEIKKLMATCKGSHFAALRDLAMLWLLVDIGPRVEGLSNIRYVPDDPDRHDLKLTQYRIRIRLKGGDEYWAPLGRKAAVAIDKYIRLGRDRHRHRGEDWLWLGQKGHLTVTGIQLRLRRRGEQAGVPDVHPHRFRRTSVTMFRNAGGSEEEAMHNYGWKSPEMPRHYTKATAKERARRAHAKYSPGDRF